jgi:hypothetical protein
MNSLAHEIHGFFLEDEKYSLGFFLVFVWYDGKEMRENKIAEIDG